MELLDKLEGAADEARQAARSAGSPVASKSGMRGVDPDEPNSLPLWG